MDKLVLSKVITISFLCTILLVLVYVAIHLYYSVQNESRIQGFTLDIKNENQNSFADNILDFFYKIIKRISILLNKSKVFKDYAKHFNKYFIYIRTNSLESIDYISFKFIILIVFQFIYILCSIISITKFNFMVLILVSIFSFFVIDIAIIINYHSKKKQIEEQLLQAIIIMNSAFKSGKNIMQAIDIVKEELTSPIKEEFEIVSKDVNYGLSLYEAFSRFSDRVKIEEAKYITSSLSLLSKTGGNIVTVFNMIEKNFYDRLRIKNELSAMTATSKFLYHFLTVIPFIFVAAIVLLNPEYFNPLFTSKIGIFLIIIMLVMYIFYFIIIRKIMKVDEV